MFEIFGHYKILERIGAGGMGEVYRARDTRLGRTVAIKIMAAGIAGDEAQRERFVREARATAALSHPNIAALYEVGEDQGQLFLVFEFVPGETLNTVIGGRPLNPRRAVDFATQIADALADAHAEGIVHRDIKPANVIITPKDKAKILDFGLATWTAGGAEREHAVQDATVLVTTPGTTLGTVAYMSPEQALGDKVDHRTDIFSLGIVLFEMLTGRLPFTGATPTAVSLQIVQAPAPAPSSMNRSLPSELDVITARALAKSVSDRYETAATMAAELRSVGAILDVRSEALEAAGVAATTSVSREPSRSIVGWLILLLLLAATAAILWVERAPIQRLWRRTMGPAPAAVIAVIPFDTESSQTFFADGLAEDLITRLGQTPGLKVIGRSATRNYRGRTPRDVARELGAGVILTGSLRPSGETIKASLELVDPSDGTALWSAQYTRDVKDIFAVQAQIAEEVAGALRVKLQPTAAAARASARTVDPRAYDLYVRGRQAIADRRPADGIKQYEQSIAADPGLAEAFAGIAEAIEYSTIILGQPFDALARQRLKTAAERAYQLDPDLPQSNLAMALAAVPLRDTLGFLRHALEIDPSYAEGLHQIGDQLLDVDPARAIDFYRASLAADPGLVPGYTDIANALITLDRPDEAHREVDALRVEPFPGWRDAFHVLIDLDQRQWDAALRRLEHSPMPPPFRVPLRLRVLASAGRFREALQELASLSMPQTCAITATRAGLLRDTGAGVAARQIAGAIVAEGDGDAPDSEAIRCAVFAAAAIGDGATAATLLQRIAGREEWLRHWARQVGGVRGAALLRGRMYPFNRIVDTPPMVAARRQIDAAYAREREIARTALAGLP